MEGATEEGGEELHPAPLEDHAGSEPLPAASQGFAAATKDGPAYQLPSTNGERVAFQGQTQSPSQRRSAGAGSGLKVSRMMVFLTLTGAFAAGVAITTGILGRIETEESELP